MKLFIITILIAIPLAALALARIYFYAKKYEWNIIPVPEIIRYAVMILVTLLMPIANISIFFMIGVMISGRTISEDIERVHETLEENIRRNY